MPSYQQTLLAATFHALAFVTTSNAATDLGSAAAYGALAASDLTSTGLSIVNGDIGVYPGTSITGFPPGVFTGIESDGDPAAATAQSDAADAYQAAIALPCGTDLTGEDLGGQTLAPGVYCFSSSATLTGILTLDAGGNSKAQFVFQIGSTLGTATGSQVLLVNGAQSCGVTWAVGSSATLGTGTDLVGDILAEVSITLDSAVTSQGGLYALTGGITLIDDTISQNTCTVGVTSSTASVTQPVTTSSPTISSTLSTVVSTTSSTVPSSSTLSSLSTLSMSSSLPSSSHSTSKPSSTSSSTRSSTLSTSCSSTHSSSSIHSASLSSTHSSSSTPTTKLSTPSSSHHTTTTSTHHHTW